MKTADVNDYAFIGVDVVSPQSLGPFDPAHGLDHKPSKSRMIFRAMPEKIPGFGAGPKYKRLAILAEQRNSKITIF